MDAGDARAYDYDLPPGAIATRPAEPRDAARLLVVRRATGALEDRVFLEVPDLLEPGDLLVVNDTRVIPARLRGRREDTGGQIEVFLLHAEPPSAGEGPHWRVLASPGRRLRPGVRISLEEGAVAEVVAVHESGERSVRIFGAPDVLAFAERHGSTPLPPYIERAVDERDRTDYQTVYAAAPGAVAAPTAGLHWTPALLERARARGIGVEALTLHVGPGTFRPVQGDDLGAHRMHAEPYAIPAATAAVIARAHAAGRRVVAVGTTVVRALEAAAEGPGRVRTGHGETDLFIRPGHEFRAVTGLVTNFHLPRSTLLVLVAAFAGHDLVMAAYAHAIRAGYRFYSYGDAMLVL